MIQMSPHQGNQSEIALLIQQWDAEAEAMRQGLQGLALGTAQHAIITRRMNTALSKMSVPEMGQEAQSDPETTA
jgi:hypothetical protein